MTELQSQLWVADVAAATAFYQAAFGAEVVHRVGDEDDPEGVAQLSNGDVRFWIANADPERKRLDPLAAGGATGRTLLVVDDPDAVLEAASAAAAELIAPAAEEHGWRLGRCVDLPSWPEARGPDDPDADRTLGGSFG